MKILAVLKPGSISQGLQAWFGGGLFCVFAGLAPIASTCSQENSKPRDEKKAAAVMKKDLIIKRVFDAPVDAVWKAWTEPAQIRHWWGPTGFTCPSAKVDLREGGIALVCMKAPKDFGGQGMYSTWAYKKIVPQKCIEYIHNLADCEGKSIDPTSLGMPADFPRDQLHTVVFQSVGPDKTELTITEFGWTVGPMREMSELGMNQCLDKMAALLAKSAK